MGHIDIFNHEYGIDPLKPYASRVFNCSVVGANEIVRLMDHNVPRDVWLGIVFEFMYFYLALTDGQVLKDVAGERKEEVTNGLVDLLIPRAVDYIFEIPNERQSEMHKQQHMKMAIARLKAYKEYKRVLPDTEKDLKGTALGSLCASVSELVGHPGNPMYEMACYSHVTESMAFLKMRAFVTSVT
jgi:hypothetical protein